MTLTSTTLSAAVAATGLYVPLASLSGVRVGSVLVCGREALIVTGLEALGVRVTRGQASTPAEAHPSGATVYVGAAADFYTRDPIGVPPSPVLVTPWINVRTGDVWTVVDGAWTRTAPSPLVVDGNQDTSIAALEAFAALKIATVTLTNAQIKALPTPPTIEILAAQGADVVTIPRVVVLAVDTTAGAYTNVSPDGAVMIAGASKPIDGFLNVAGVNQYLITPTFSGAGDYRNAPYAIQIDNALLGNITGGHADNTLTVTIYYLEIEL